MKTKILTLFLLVFFSFHMRAYAETLSPKPTEAAPLSAPAAEKPAVEKTASVQDLLEKMNPNTGKGEKPILSPTLQAEDNLLNNEEKRGVNVLSQAKNQEGLPWMRTVLGTLFVCSSIVVVFLFLNAKGKANGVFQASKNQPLKILQKLNLGLKTEVVLLDWEGSRLLLSVQASQVQVLQSLQNKVEEEARPVISAQEKQNKEFQILEELQLSKNQLHFEAKEKLSNRVREVVQKLSPLPSMSSMGFRKSESLVEEQGKKALSATA
ncbi:MAG: flagellar biosynthetic protein FliO [Deltaproteobacteria bacterium]|nr:flagellar biosynthetic protein FliO [Deltaproteobacteria bacterium]